MNLKMRDWYFREDFLEGGKGTWSLCVITFAVRLEIDERVNRTTIAERNEGLKCTTNN